jgi:hypothetical protein
MSDSLRFGQEWWLVSKEWADGWAAHFGEYFQQVLKAYRQRVSQYYRQDASNSPESYPLFGPVDVLAVASLVRTWIFARPTLTDSIAVDQRWEDPALANRSLLDAPNHEAVVRSVAGIDPGYVLISTHRLDNLVSPQSGGDVFAGRFKQEEGRNLADTDHRHAQLVESVQALASHLTSRHIDREALRAIQGELAELEQSTQYHRRGYRLQQLMLDTFRAHGCEAELGDCCGVTGSSLFG